MPCAGKHRHVRLGAEWKESSFITQALAGQLAKCILKPKTTASCLSHSCASYSEVASFLIGPELALVTKSEASTAAQSSTPTVSTKR